MSSAAVRPARRALVTMLALSLALPVVAQAAPPVGEARLPSLDVERDAGDVAPRGLIVTYRAGATARQRSALRATQRLALIGTIADRVEVLRPAVSSLETAAAELRARPEVASVAFDAHRTISVDPRTEPNWPLQWGHHNTGQAVEGFAGTPDVDVDGLEAINLLPATSSVVVAVIDDGVDFSHPDLAGSAWVNPGESGPDGVGGNRASNGVDDDANGYVDDVNGWDFCNDDNSVHDPFEDYHGTAVASTIAAPVNGSGMAGIAPGVRIMALKFIQNEADPSDPACGWDSMAIEAINYAKARGVRIINASWGGTGGDPALEAAIESSGALVVAAAGNEDTNIDLQPTYPASFDSPNLLTVAAIHNEGELTGFTNYGRVSVDLSAPGEDVVAALPATPAHPGGPWWALIDGTSFSAPYVAGIAALAGAARPSVLLTPTVLRNRLLATGTPLPATSGLTATGRLANARRAIDFAPPTLSGSVSVLPTVATMGTSSIKVRLSWAQGVDDLGMGSYRVEQRRNGGAWTQAIGLTTARTHDLVIALGGTHEFRVSPRDALGNLGAPVHSRVLSGTRADDSVPTALYTGTWGSAPLSTAFGGRVRYTTASNASVTYTTFDGRTVAVVAPTGPTRSSFKVYVDGVYVRTVSLYSTTTKPPTVVFTTGTMAAGTHKVTLVHTRVGSRIRAEVDAFVVLR